VSSLTIETALAAFAGRKSPHGDTPPHELVVVLEDGGPVSSYRLARPGTRMMCVQLTFTAEGICIQGDLTPQQNGTVSCLGYGLHWFTRALGPQYLAEKFLKTGFVGDLAEEGVREWLNDPEQWREVVLNGIASKLKEEDRRRRKYGHERPDPILGFLGKSKPQPMETTLRCEACGFEEIDDYDSSGEDGFRVGQPCPEYVEVTEKDPRWDPEAELLPEHHWREVDDVAVPTGEAKCGGTVVVHELGRVDEAAVEAREQLEQLAGSIGDHGPRSFCNAIEEIIDIEGECIPGWGYDPNAYNWLAAIQQTFRRLWWERDATNKAQALQQARKAGKLCQADPIGLADAPRTWVCDLPRDGGSQLCEFHDFEGDESLPAEPLVGSVWKRATASLSPRWYGAGTFRVKERRRVPRLGRAAFNAGAQPESTASAEELVQREARRLNIREDGFQWERIDDLGPGDNKTGVVASRNWGHWLVGMERVR